MTEGPSREIVENGSSLIGRPLFRVSFLTQPDAKLILSHSTHAHVTAHTCDPALHALCRDVPPSATPWDAPWAAPWRHGAMGKANGRDVSPDDESQRMVSKALARAGGSFGKGSGRQYPADRMNELVYPVHGGMEVRHVCVGIVSWPPLCMACPRSHVLSCSLMFSCDLM